MDRVLSPGTLWGYLADPNPNGAGESTLYAFTGDATSDPIREILWDSAATFPEHSRLGASQAFSLRIYHFNDLHGHLTHRKQGEEEPVLARLAGEIHAAREACRGNPAAATFVLAAGDDCSGSIFDEMMGETGVHPFHPGYRSYSKMGIDAAVLGNHELDRGLPFLIEAIRRDARFPILATNLKGCPELSTVCPPAAILVVKGVRVGLIGIVTRAETHLDPAQCQILDPVLTVRNMLPAIRPLCDVLVILSHLGYSLEKSNVPMADAGDVELARSLAPGFVDLIVGGHSHSALNKEGLQGENIVNGIPIVQAGAMGEFLGQVDLLISGEGVSVTTARLIPTRSLPLDHIFQEKEIQPILNRVEDLLGRSLGKIEPGLGLSTETVQKDFARGELALVNFVTDALVSRLAKRGLIVDLAMIDSSALLSGLPLGETLTLGDWFQVMPYTDTIRLFTLSLSQLEDLLNDNTQRIDRPGEAHIERGFLHFSRQLRYRVELGLTRQEATAKDITMDGIPLREYQKEFFTLATTSFTRQSAAAWETTLDRNQAKRLIDLHELPFTETDIFLRQEMIAYIKDHGGVSRCGGARLDGRLQLHPLQDYQEQGNAYEYNSY